MLCKAKLGGRAAQSLAAIAMSKHAPTCSVHVCHSMRSHAASSTSAVSTCRVVAQARRKAGTLARTAAGACQSGQATSLRGTSEFNVSLDTLGAVSQPLTYT